MTSKLEPLPEGPEGEAKKTPHPSSPTSQRDFSAGTKVLAVDAYEQCVHRDRAIAAGNNRIHVNFREAPF